MLAYRLAALAVAVVALAAGSATAQTCTTTYTAAAGNADGNGWFEDGNWSDGVPTAADTACVSGSGNNFTRTVTATAPVTLGGLLVDGFLGARLDLRFLGGLALTGRARITSPSSATNVSGDITVQDELVLDPGHIVTRGGVLTVEEGARLVVRNQTGTNGGGYSSIGGGNAAGSLSELRVFGTLEVYESLLARSTFTFDGATIRLFDDPDTASPGQTDIAWFDNGGLVRNVQVFTEPGTQLLLNGDVTLEGTLSGASDGGFAFAQNTVAFGGGSLTLGSGDVTLDVGGANGLSLYVQQFSNRPAYIITSNGGRLVNENLLRVPGGQRFFQDVEIVNRATMEMSGAARIYLQDDSQLTVEQTGTLALTDAGGTGNRAIYGESFADPGTARLAVQGRLVHAGSFATDHVYVPIDVDGGEVEVTSGRLTLARGGTMTDAALTVAPGALLWAHRDWDLAGTLSGTAADEESLAFYSQQNDVPVRLRATGGDVTLDVGGAGLRIEQTAFGPPAELSSPDGSAFVAAGRTVLDAQVEIDGITLLSAGGLALDRARPTFLSGGEIVNPAGQTLSIIGSTFAVGDAGGQFVNRGVASIETTLQTIFGDALDSRPGSELRALGALVNLQSTDPAAYGAGVAVTGNGRVSRPAGTPYLGTLSPGTPDLPTDTLRFDHFAPEGDARLVIDLAPGRADQVTTFGTFQNPVTLGGTLVVRLAPGYVPAPDDSWIIVREETNRALEGDFAAVEIVGGPPSAAFSIDRSVPSEVRLVSELPKAVSATDAVAEERGLAPGHFTVYRTDYDAPGQPQLVTARLSGTATRYQDYTADLSRTGLVTVPAGADSVVVGVYPMTDFDAEPLEWVVLEVAQGDGFVADSVQLIDSPPDGGFIVYGSSPDRAANVGGITVVVSGEYLEPETSVSLTGSGEEIEADSVWVGAAGSVLTAYFDLAQAQEGVRDLRLEASGVTRTIGNALAIETARFPEVTVRVEAPPRVAVGRTAEYRLILHNTGNVRVLGTAGLTGLPASTEWEIDVEVPRAGGLPPIPWHEAFPAETTEEGLIILLPPLLLAPGEETVLAIRAVVPSARPVRLVGAWQYRR